MSAVRFLESQQGSNFSTNNPAFRAALTNALQRLAQRQGRQGRQGREAPAAEEEESRDGQGAGETTKAAFARPTFCLPFFSSSSLGYVAIYPLYCEAVL